MAITIHELAEYRLKREASNGSDFAEAELPMMGGCEHCAATIASYNSFPSTSGWIRCRDCIGSDGYDTVEIASMAIFGQ